MKRNKTTTILFILLLSLIFSSCTKEINIKDASFRNGLAYLKEDEKPYTGIIEEYYENGKMKLRIEYKNGLKNGGYESYYENGKLRREETYKMGRLIGKVKWFHESGKSLADFEISDSVKYKPILLKSSDGTESPRILMVENIFPYDEVVTRIKNGQFDWEKYFSEGLNFSSNFNNIDMVARVEDNLETTGEIIFNDVKFNGLPNFFYLTKGFNKGTLNRHLQYFAEAGFISKYDNDWVFSRKNIGINGIITSQYDGVIAVFLF